jgi:hypothetical protein
MAFEIQKQIRQNATDIRDYVDDLYKWEDKLSVAGPTKPKVVFDRVTRLFIALDLKQCPNTP